MEGGPEGVPTSGLPGEAPPFLWVIIIAAAVLWWLWPWLERWQESRRAASQPPVPQDRAVMEMMAHAVEKEKEEVKEVPEEAVMRPDLGFDPEETFNENYAEACDLLQHILSVPPMGEKFTAAVSGLHSLANILDRLFQAWADEKEKFSQIKEDSDAFLKSFGTSDSALRKLLAHAGFQRQVTESSKSVWYFDRQDPEIRLRGLTVRLCLQRFSELQRLRGTHRWAQSNNSAVVPSADASLYELLELYKGPDAEGERPSIRERNLEAEVRAKIQERRAEAQLSGLTLHEGLASAARRLAQRQRVGERQGKSQMTKLRSSDVRELLAKMPLPPGFTAAQLYFRSTELPSIFGLTSSTGSGATPMGGKNDEKDKDKAADILAREAVGYWAARQAQDVAWPSASLCGVGAALDYTVNRGFVVALLIGFEGATVEEASTSQRSAMQSLRRRQAAAKEAASKAQPSATFGARVRTLGAPTADAVLNRK